MWRSSKHRSSLFMCQERSRKQFQSLLKSYQARTSLIMCQERSRIFSPLLRSCEARVSLFMCVKGLESGFHHTRGPVKLVQACLCARKDLESGFHHTIGPVKLVQACLSVRKYLESGFHHCAGTSCETRSSLFMCEERSRKQFSPPLGFGEARASMFMCDTADLTTVSVL